MKTNTFNPQATFHLGMVHYAQGSIAREFSSVPVGVNAFGLTIEDAFYDLLDEDQAKFAAAIFGAMKEGRTCGAWRDMVWAYEGAESCHETDML